MLANGSSISLFAVLFSWTAWSCSQRSCRLICIRSFTILAKMTMPLRNPPASLTSSARRYEDSQLLSCFSLGLRGTSGQLGLRGMSVQLGLRGMSVQLGLRTGPLDKSERTSTLSVPVGSARLSRHHRLPRFLSHTVGLWTFKSTCTETSIHPFSPSRQKGPPTNYRTRTI